MPRIEVTVKEGYADPRAEDLQKDIHDLGMAAVVERARGVELSSDEGSVEPALLWLSGCSFLALGQADSALERFEQALRVSPRSDWAQWAQLGRGDCYFAQQEYDRAVAEYELVLDAYRYSQAFPFALSGLARSSPDWQTRRGPCCIATC